MVGINASLITFIPGTTISSAQVNSNFQSLAAKGVNNDNGTITTDGAGNLSVAGLNAAGIIVCSKVDFQVGAIQQFKVFNGVGTTTTATHGCNVRPTSIVTFYTNGSNGAFSSNPATICYAFNYGATTCSVSAAAGFAWNGIAVLGG